MCITYVVNDGSVHYFDCGSRVTVVFGHGTLVSLICVYTIKIMTLLIIIIIIHNCYLFGMNFYIKPVKLVNLVYQIKLEFLMGFTKKIVSPIGV